MRKFVAIIGLQAYALALAFAAHLGGVRTDEAKYLLNIPYPHPPLARTVLSQTYGMPLNDVFWRIVFASLVVHAVWIVVRLPQRASSGAQLLLAAAWLLSAAVVLQAGTIMMAPLTALCGLVLLWAAARPRTDATCWCMALFWMASLFIAYQSVLFLPVTVAIFLRSKQPVARTLLYVLGPLLALALYTLTNPFAAQLLLQVSSAHVAPLAGLQQLAWLWLWAGSGIVSVFGTALALRRSRPELAIVLGVLLAYIFRSYHQYYAIFLVPVFVAAIANAMDARSVQLQFLNRSLVAAAFVLGLYCAGWAAWAVTAADRINIARDTVVALQPYLSGQQPKEVSLLIVGDFGHEWQYYAPAQVTELRKYSEEMTVQDADIVVCWSACPSSLLENKEAVARTPVPTYVRRNAALQI